MSAISVYFLAFGLRIAGSRRFYPQWFPGETSPETHDLQEAYEMITNRFEEWNRSRGTVRFFLPAGRVKVVDSSSQQ